MNKNPVKKIRKNYTLEVKTVEIIEEMAIKEKRPANSVVDILVQKAAEILAANT